MTTEIFTFCDSATDYNGQLVIVGTFNNIYAQSFPALHPTLAFVAKVAFDENESREAHQFRFRIQKSDEEIVLMDTGVQAMNLQYENGKKANANILLKADNIMLPKPGVYIASLEIDNKVIKDTELSVIELQQN